jgi:uncharacterized SAM-binding protein YcdF (DUF218 family)
MGPALRRSIRAITAGFGGLGLLVTVVTFTPLVSWWARALAGPWTDPIGDVLIVLGGSSLEDGVIGENSYWRSVYAVRAYREGFQRIVISGGGSIAGSMSDFVRCQGIPASAIQLESRSEDTRQNAMFTRTLLAGEAGRKVLMTSDYHMFRAHRAFRKAGIDVLPRPIPDAMKRATRFNARWSVFVDLTRETAAIAYYFARGWI